MAPAKNMPALPWFFDAYLVDTIHLKTVEHGAYLLLLGHAWKQGGYLPDDDARLAAMTFLAPDQWLQIKGAVMSFWTLSKRGWSQKRLLKELRYVHDASNRRREAGKKGGQVSARKRKRKEGSNATAMLQPGLSNAQAPTPTPTLVDKSTEDAALFERAAEVLGKGQGALITKLKRAKGGSIPLARAALETAATKHDPKSYLWGVVNTQATDAEKQEMRNRMPSPAGG